MENKEVNHWHKANMTKELAEKIIRLNIDEERISNEKYAIRNQVISNGGGTWENVCNLAMLFLLELDKAKK